MRIILIVLILSSLAFPDTVKFLNGCTIYNVRVVTATHKNLKLITASGKKVNIQYPDRYRVIKLPVSQFKLSRITGNCSRSVRDAWPEPIEKTKLEITQDKKNTVSVRSILFSTATLALAIDFFMDASDIGDNISAGKKAGINTSHLSGVSNRKYIIGGILALSSLINITLSFDDSSVSLFDNSIHYSYRF